jgi:hypothetical protein
MIKISTVADMEENQFLPVDVLHDIHSVLVKVTAKPPNMHHPIKGILHTHALENAISKNNVHHCHHHHHHQEILPLYSIKVQTHHWDLRRLERKLLPRPLTK